MREEELIKIKKLLYKNKPIAIKVGEYGDYESNKMEGAIYATNTALGDIEFYIPYADMGDKEFNDEEPAQLLIRWMKTINGNDI